MKHIFKKNILTGSILLIAGLLFLVINVMSSTMFKALRLDLTRDRLYTLSSGTKEILQEIDEPIIIRYYFSTSLKSINPYLTSFAKRVEDLLQQYQRIAKGKIKLEVIDPIPFSVQEDEAVNYGLQGVPVDSTGTEFYLGIVGTNSLDTKQVISFLQPAREATLEYDISQLIYNLMHPQPRIVGVMSSLALAGGYTSRPYAIWQQMEQLFTLEQIDINTSEIPANINTLMVVEPSTFSPGALAAIDKFVMSGGHVLAFIDPVAEVADKRAVMLNKAKQKDSGDYLALLKSWGIDFDDSKAVADKELAKTVRAPYEGREVSIRYPLWMDFVAANFNKDDILSSSLERLTIATPGAIRHTADATSTFIPLITSSDQAMLVEGRKVDHYQQNLQLLFNDYKAEGQFVIGARITGPINSAYGDERTTDSNIIVIADTDMLHDHFWMHMQNIMGQEFAVPAASNGNLVLSALENLSGSNALISIRSRAGFTKPFDTIRKLELESAEKYHESEQVLQQKLIATKQKLDALESQKLEGNKLSITAQEKYAEEQFRQELVEIRRDLREVRRKLNQDIETVATNVKFYAIGLIPALIMLSGLVAWILQRKNELKVRKAHAPH